MVRRLGVAAFLLPGRRRGLGRVVAAMSETAPTTARDAFYLAIREALG